MTPTDLQQLSVEPKGKRPGGTRLVSEPATLAHQLQALEVSKGRRGLLDRFLMKRKAAPVTPELGPVSPRFQSEPEIEHDPRIVGKRFHDFDNPDRRKPVTQHQAFPGQPASTVDHSKELHGSPLLADSSDINIRSTPQLQGHGFGVESPESTRGDAASAFAGSPMIAGAADQQSVKHQDKRRALSLDKALPKEPDSLVSEEGHDPTDRTSFSSASPAVSRRCSSVLPRSTPSARTLQSRNASLSGPKRRGSAVSAVPRHMKSTSSRFSFDMVGAANQEKLLEEKHRQRQIEKGVDDGTFAAKDGDSRFDDFDNEDFDYDAMMDDDGLEERIPGVNADAEDDDDYLEEEIPGVNADAEDQNRPGEGADEEQDPDNDQENFSGFVFQRSHPASAVTSPVPPDMLPTPRDPTGKVIGYAVTKDSTPDLAPGPSPLYHSSFSNGEPFNGSSEGLGIQGLTVQHQPAYAKLPYEYDRAVRSTDGVSAPGPIMNDDLYYDDDFIDDGLREELNFEPEGPAFDESLFDLNDTDKYGRPLPGVFANAKLMMAAQQQQQASNRHSDETSRMSGQSAITRSTAHTSLDAGVQPVPPTVDNKETVLELPQLSERRSSAAPAPGLELAYQAALAEAAHKAAASGKFRRGSSPLPPDPHLTVTSPTDSAESRPKSRREDGLDVDDDNEACGLDDDYDFDDDVIAEANAEALANDADGWYGREFGFYSAPMPAPSHGHGQHGITSSSPKPLSAENLFHYANGGYFGPAGGVMRSPSGRMVSREPNLTPITERSEYSNRNSTMSFGGPSGASQVQSPGLAELALLEDDPNMSMSAFLRLRSKTFGSSKASLLSSPEGSPRSEFSPTGLGVMQQRDDPSSPWGTTSSSSNLGGHHASSHMRKSSTFSLQSISDEDGGSGGSPTMTMSAPLPPPVPSSPSFPPGQPAQPSLGVFTPVLEEDDSVRMAYRDTADSQNQKNRQDVPLGGFLPADTLHTTSPTTAVDDGGPRPPLSPLSPTSPFGFLQQQQHPHKRPGIGHRHKGSADSISYIMEEDSGETRWVMERRRTAETGEVEFVEREVVRGGI